MADDKNLAESVVCAAGNEVVQGAKDDVNGLVQMAGMAKKAFGFLKEDVKERIDWLKMSPEEKAAIRFHMGFSEPKELYNALGSAFEKYPLAMALHFSDLISSHLIEAKD